eukprot:TRINITY_DN4584_c0_g1_i1.p1 TRINITY_DN4584_c0_g1~~TRINITY_DN4584_c0_g1_i1.p1  ORF type:complete len:116 (-),score=11.89 TRINITY_DN4584_c0_g1_i1:74-421(-)
MHRFISQMARVWKPMSPIAMPICAGRTGALNKRTFAMTPQLLQPTLLRASDSIPQHSIDLEMSADFLLNEAELLAEANKDDVFDDLMLEFETDTLEEGDDFGWELHQSRVDVPIE